MLARNHISKHKSHFLKLRGISNNAHRISLVHIWWPVIEDKCSLLLHSLSTWNHSACWLFQAIEGLKTHQGKAENSNLIIILILSWYLFIFVLDDFFECLLVWRCHFYAFNLLFLFVETLLCEILYTLPQKHSLLAALLSFKGGVLNLWVFTFIFTSWVE